MVRRQYKKSRHRLVVGHAPPPPSGVPNPAEEPGSNRQQAPNPPSEAAKTFLAAVLSVSLLAGIAALGILGSSVIPGGHQGDSDELPYITSVPLVPQSRSDFSKGDQFESEAVALNDVPELK